MSRRIAVMVALAAVLAAGIIAWQFANPRAREIRRIQKRLHSLARDASFSERDHPFKRLAYSGTLGGYFADSIKFETAIGQIPENWNPTRSELESGAAGLRATKRGLDVKFLDITVTLEQPPTNAAAYLTSKLYMVGDSDYVVQELRLGLVKTEGKWLVNRIGTVRTMER